MAKGKKRRELEEISGTWMTSYGDMITLLLCFFVMLFTMSTLDAQKWKVLSESIKESFGVEGKTLPAMEEIPAEIITQMEEPRLEEEVSPRETLEQLKELEAQIDKYIAKAGLEAAIQTEIEEIGLVIRMSTDEILFELGSAQLKPMAMSFLDAISGILKSTANEIWVEGHTDNIPILPGYVYPSNWELSTARACSVVRYLIEHNGLPADRMQAAGYADTKPRFPNDTEEHRYLNRRVEIVIRPLAELGTGLVDWKKQENATGTGSETGSPPAGEGDQGGEGEGGGIGAGHTAD